MKKFQVVHYLNQFFGGVGGEDKADIMPRVVAGAVGPGLALPPSLEVVATVICGDNYFAEHTEEAANTGIELIKQFAPDIVLAGPAFNAGRYGVACGEICKRVLNELKIPAVTAMYDENPGTELYKSDVVIVKAGSTARTMRDTIAKLSAVAYKLAMGEEVHPEEDHYFKQGIKRNIMAEHHGAKRAVDMLLAKIRKEEFVSEVPLPDFETVQPAKPVSDLSKATIAIVTDGGLYPMGNPDGIEAGNATKWGRYSIAGVSALQSKDYKVNHGGYDNSYVNENPNRLVPVDALRALEEEHYLGALYNEFFSTTGVVTPIANSQRFGREMAQALIAAGVDGVILTST